MTGEDLKVVLKKHPLGVVCALLSVVCGVLLYYRSDAIATSQTELEARTAEASKMAANVRNSSGLSEQVAELQAQRKELESRLLKGSQLAVNLQYFYKLEAETEVKLSGDVRQGTVPRVTKTYVGVPFSVSVDGSYAQITNFVSRLQNGRHFCRITSATIIKATNSETGKNSSERDMNLSLNLELLGQP